MNTDHREALALYATRLAGEPPTEWRTTGVDPDGIDLAAGDRTARVPFPHRVDGPGPQRAVLKALADDARARR
jgi:putative heme iron utilization protein